VRTEEIWLAAMRGSPKTPASALKARQFITRRLLLLLYIWPIILKIYGQFMLLCWRSTFFREDFLYFGLAADGCKGGGDTALCLACVDFTRGLTLAAVFPAAFLDRAIGAVVATATAFAVCFRTRAAGSVGFSPTSSQEDLAV
jgi:hypothetical protein